MARAREDAFSRDGVFWRSGRGARYAIAATQDKALVFQGVLSVLVGRADPFVGRWRILSVRLRKRGPPSRDWIDVDCTAAKLNRMSKGRRNGNPTDSIGRWAFIEQERELAGSTA